MYKKIIKKSIRLTIVLHTVRMLLGVIIWHIKYFRNNEKKFKYGIIKKILDKKKYNEIVVLGSGKSINELDVNDYVALKQYCTVAVGRWIYNDFVPDIYSIETQPVGPKANWLIDFAELLISKSNEYKNTVILIEGASSSQMKYLKKKLNGDIYSNTYFFKSVTQLNGVKYFLPFIKLINYFKLPQLFNFIVHCRSSTGGMTMMGYYLKVNRIIIIGVDGFTGYFCNNADFNKDYGGLEKNMQYKYHSTADPNFGEPTLQQCLTAISYNLIECNVISDNTILASSLKKTSLVS